MENPVQRVAALLPEIRHLLARCQADFNSANQLGGIIGVNLGGRGGIEALENSVEICGAALLRALAQTGAQFFGTLRAGKEAFEQSAQVEACTSDENWQVLARLDLGQDLAGLAGIFSRSHVLGGIDAVKQMMRNLGAFGGSGLGGSNI